MLVLVGFGCDNSSLTAPCRLRRLVSLVKQEVITFFDRLSSDLERVFATTLWFSVFVHAQFVLLCLALVTCLSFVLVTCLSFVLVTCLSFVLLTCLSFVLLTCLSLFCFILSLLTYDFLLSRLGTFYNLVVHVEFILTI